MSQSTVYTIGHSDRALTDFLGILQEMKVTHLADVRSIPRTDFAPQFNRDTLEPFLAGQNITYLGMAEEFGARRSNIGLLDADGKVNYDKVRRSPEFQRGVAKIRADVAAGALVALMCNEANPIVCHRFSLISLGLQDAGLTVKHIMRNRMVLDNAVLEKEILAKYEAKIPKPDMFRPVVTLDEQVRAAYRLQNKAVAHSTLEGTKK